MGTKSHALSSDPDRHFERAKESTRYPAMSQKDRFKTIDIVDLFSIGVIVASTAILGYLILLLVKTWGG